MASNRHLGRVIAFQTLYEQEFRLESKDSNFDLDEVLKRNIERYHDTIEDKQFVSILVKGITKDHLKLDAIIQPIASKWPLEQISKMDLIILRMGLFELLNMRETPYKVVINESVELAKSFGGENSSKFINGVLGKVYSQEIEEVTNNKVKKKSSVKAKPN